MGLLFLTSPHLYFIKMVLVSRESRRAIFEYLLREGVVVVKKDAYLPAHAQLPSVCNLHVMMIVKSLKSRGYLNEVYTWGWSYYFLTNAGVKFLIQELGLPADSKIVPNTHTKNKQIIQAVETPAKGEDEKPTKGEE